MTLPSPVLRRFVSHDLEMEGSLALTHRAKAYLAIVDLGTYPVLAGEAPDHLDLLTHLCDQTQALKAVIWETPPETLKLNVILTADGRQSNELLRTHRLVFDGCVRTATGQLCLTDDEGLLAAARLHARDLLHGKRSAETRCPQLLNVRPGVINVGVFCERSHGPRIPELEHDRADYTVLMRHYPFPPPRVAPVRLSGGLLPFAGEPASAEPWGGGHFRFSE